MLSNRFRGIPLSVGVCEAFGRMCVTRVSRRWFDWDPRVTRKNGKPAMTGSKAAYVAADIPVVLLRDVEGLGPKGSITEVRRGYARNVLIPNGDAVYGTVWENIDAFADPDIARNKKLAESSATEKERAPFDWLNTVRVEFVRDTVPRPVDVPSKVLKLVHPITLAEVLTALSTSAEIDLFPNQISFPAEGIEFVGQHDIPVTIQWIVSSHTYTIKVDVKDREEVASAERREAELREAMKMKRPDFVLGSHTSAAKDGAGRDTDSDSDSDEEFGDNPDTSDSEK